MAPDAKLWPLFITASSWGTIWTTTFQAALRKRGRGTAPDGSTMVPRLTNGEVITLVMAWMEAATPTRFPLWYQFAALAYGWTPDNDRIDTSAKRRDALYPTDIGHELWMTTNNLSDTLQAETPANPRLDMDGRFDDVVFQGQVRAALMSDGAQAKWVIGFAGCKDPKTGKPGLPKKNPKTGKWECNPVVIQDPITRPARNILALLLYLGAAYVILVGDKAEKARRRGARS
jgi:hypothetical protein